METLILLYALAGSNDIPQGCFIAAWAIVAVRLISRFIVKFKEIDREEKRRKRP